MAKLKPKILRVGFDLDGVLLYNPVRIVRPIIVFIKALFLPKERNKFHLPKNRLQKFVWGLLHKSSFTPANGNANIRQLMGNKKIKGYVISARYESLKSDFDSWIKKLDKDNQFSAVYYNNNNEQPHLFKERMINELKLDIFIEDNWDIVNHLSKKTKTRIFWIYNLLDRNIKYKYKFPTLKKAVEKIL